ncbi:MAG TPA: transposase, partial [Myxococcales bacterium]
SEFSFPRRGGARRGAGRRPRGPLPLVSHRARPRFEKPTPVHVTLRVHREVWNLRSSRCYRRIQTCFEKARGRFGVRLVQFTIQGNHLHLILEADSNESLSRGLQGLCIRIAKALNAMMSRPGPVFADHYHSRLLRTPTELVNAIRYVLGNHTHHFRESGRDPFSSAALTAAQRLLLLCAPVGWLLRAGWKKARGPAPPNSG